MKGIIQAFQAMIYVVGAFLTIMGICSLCVAKKNVTWCTTLYLVFLPCVIVLLFVMAIPVLITY